jgi:hypothetical protein
MSDTRPEPAGPAGDAPAYIPKPADLTPAGPTPAGPALTGEPVHILRGTVTAVDAHHYRASIEIEGLGEFPSRSYNPLAYIPRLDEKVLVAVVGSDPNNPLLVWVLGIASGRMFSSPTFGRPPTAALWSDTRHTIESGTQQLQAVRMDHKAWDTDNMLIELGNGEMTTMITPQRTGVYTVKAGGRWDKDPQLRGRRGMDLRWVDKNKPVRDHVIIARDEKAPNSEGECSHSVSADIRITTSIDPAHASPWVRYLGAAVELVAYQTSGRRLRLLSDHVSKPFLQMTYQGPMP